MSSSNKKGKLGGKKLSANKQLLALQDALTSGVSELQLAAQRLGDHQITMSTGTNQEKRGAKEAYAKVKVEVTTLEVEVEELKDVLQVLKALKADKEALEDGYDQGMGNRGEVFMTWEGFEPGTWSLELWDLKRFELRTL